MSQQVRGVLNPALANQLTYGAAVVLVELTGKMDIVDPNLGGNFRQAQTLQKTGLDNFSGVFEPARNQQRVGRGRRGRGRRGMRHGGTSGHAEDEAKRDAHDESAHA